MDNKAKIVLGTALGAATLYMLYQLIYAKKGTASVPGKSSLSDFSQVLDQRAPADIQEKQAKEFVSKYIESKIGKRPINLTADGNNIDSEDFNKLIKVMNFYAHSKLYDIKLNNQRLRLAYLNGELTDYVDLMRNQQLSEVDIYTDALNLICETSKCSSEIFMNTYTNQG